MKITAARFVGAAAAPGQEPPAGPPEVAFAGRSNVGKSSLLNQLVGRRGLARTSGTPGRTRQLNFFLVNERFVLVDLPGYGFAVGPEAERRAWGPLVETYLERRATLRGVVLVVDVRRGIEAEEAELLAYLAARRLPALVLATKVDKLARGAQVAAVAAVAQAATAAAAEAVQTAPEASAAAGAPAVPTAGVRVLGCSGRTGFGRDAIWKVVAGWLAAPARAPS